MSTPITISPLNDCAFFIPLYVVDPDTGVKSPLLTGTASMFLSASDASDATAILNEDDEAITGTVTKTEDVESPDYLCVFQGADLESDALNTANDAAPEPGTLFAIVVHDTDYRVAVPLVFTDARRATV